MYGQRTCTRSLRFGVKRGQWLVAQVASLGS